MRVNHAASRFVVRALLGGAAVIGIIVAVTHRHEAAVVAAQEPATGSAQVPVADEYYPVKTDWIGRDRSIVTIKHVPTASCYVLVYPTGDGLLQVDKDRCASATASGAVEK